MSGRRYGVLTAPAEDAHRPELACCAGCHGLDGVGELDPHVPRIDIQGPRSGPPRARQGEALALAAPGGDDVPAFRACHGPDPSKRSDTTPSPFGQHASPLDPTPPLAGRNAGQRHTGQAEARRDDLRDEDIAALVAY